MNQPEAEPMRIETALPEKTTAEGQTYKFAAFISYRHIEPDLTIARKLHTLIETFKRPKDLQASDGQKAPFRVFRDREELTTRDLGASIEDALEHSQYLIVLCSRRTPLSPWCTREVAYFRRFHDDTHIIPVLLEGEPDEAFPDSLKGLKAWATQADQSVKEVDLELLAADLRPDEIKTPSFPSYAELAEKNPARLKELGKKSLNILKKTELYRIMATLIGCSYGDLRQRDKIRRMRRLFSLAGVVAAALLIFGIVVSALYLKSVASEREARQQTALMTLRYAQQANAEGNRGLALIIARKAMRDVTPEMSEKAKLDAQYMTLLNDALLYTPYSYVHLLETNSQSPFFALYKNGKKLLSGGEFNTAIVWDLENGAKLKTLEFESPVRSVAISKDGGSVYIATADRQIFRMDAESYAVEALMRLETSAATELGALEGGAILVARTDGGLLLIDLEKRVVYATIAFSKEFKVKSVALRPDGERIVLSNFDASVREYDSRDGRLLKTLKEATTASETSYFAYSLDGRYSLLTRDDQAVRTDLRSGQTLALQDNAFKYSDTMALSRDGRFLFVCSHSLSTSYIARYDFERPSEKKTLQYNATDLSRIVLSPDCKVLVALFKDGSLAFWSGVDAEEPVPDPLKVEKTAAGTTLGQLRFSEDSATLVANSVDSKLRVLLAAASQETQLLEGIIKARSENRRFVLLQKGQTLYLFDFQKRSAKALGELAEATEFFSPAFALSNDGSKLAFCDFANNNVKVLSTEGLRYLYSTQAHHLGQDINWVTRIQFSPDDQLLATADLRDEVILSDTAQGQFIKKLESLPAAVDHITFSPDAKLLAFVLQNGKSAVYRLSDGQSLYLQAGKILALEAENDDLKEAYGLSGKTIFRYTQAGGLAPLSQIHDFQGIVQSDTSEEFSLDRRYLLTTAGAKASIVVDVATGERIRSLEMQQVNQAQAVFGPDGQSLLYNYNESEARLVQLKTRAELESLAEAEIDGRELSDEELFAMGRAKQ